MSMVPRHASRIRLSLVLLVLVLPLDAAAQVEAIHEFMQGPGLTYGRLVQAIDGHLYGVTSEGGVYSGGTVFVIRRSAEGWGAATTLHDFRAAEGTNPIGGLIQGTPGVLYGVTSKNGARGGGTVFRINIFGTFQVLASLDPATHGAASVTELTRAFDGQFYGTTTRGGRAGLGTIFKVSPAGAITVLHAFSGGDGADPAGALALGLDGNLYGTTYYGGASGRGAAFRVTPSGAFTLLHSFEVGSIHHPAGRMVLAQDGAFYGVATTGRRVCPIVPACDAGSSPGLFRLTTTGAFGTVDIGDGPGVGVLTPGADGFVYGVTTHLGLFRVRPGSGIEWIARGGLYADIGDGVYGSVVAADDGKFYGATRSGGLGGYGAVFSIDLAGEVEAVHSFRSEGFHPTSGLLEMEAGILYGTTYRGGPGDVGTVFARFPGNTVSTVAAQPGGNGHLFGGLVEVEPGKMLATATERIMEVTTAGAISVRYQHGSNSTPVVANDGSIYFGRYNSGSAILRLPNGSFSPETIHEFDGDDQPAGGMVLHGDGNLYGTTLAGGAFGHGTVFRLAPDGTFSTLHHFSLADGKSPVARLAVGEEGALYGTTLLGGDTSDSPDGWGTIFRITTDGDFTLLHAFTAGEGRLPAAGLRRAGYFPSQTFWGTTMGGGDFGAGTLFSVTPDGTFRTVHHFRGSDGAMPFGDLTWSPGGYLYGTTVYGGRANVGVIYRLPLPAP